MIDVYQTELEDYFDSVLAELEAPMLSWPMQAQQQRQHELLELQPVQAHEQETNAVDTTIDTHKPIPFGGASPCKFFRRDEPQLCRMGHSCNFSHVTELTRADIGYELARHSPGFSGLTEDMMTQLHPWITSVLNDLEAEPTDEWNEDDWSDYTLPTASGAHKNAKYPNGFPRQDLSTPSGAASTTTAATHRRGKRGTRSTRPPRHSPAAAHTRGATASLGRLEQMPVDIPGNTSRDWQTTALSTSSASEPSCLSPELG